MNSRELVEMLTRKAAPPHGFVVQIVEDPGFTPNWHATLQCPDRGATMRFEGALSALQERHPLIDWAASGPRLFGARVETRFAVEYAKAS